MAIPARINRNASHDQTVIAVRALDDAHPTWVAAEVDPSTRCARGSTAGARRKVRRVPRIPRSGRPRGGGSA